MKRGALGGISTRARGVCKSAVLQRGTPQCGVSASLLEALSEAGQETITLTKGIAGRMDSSRHDLAVHSRWEKRSIV